MSWVKITDTALDDPRFLTLSRGVRLLHLEALAFASRHTTDGLVPTHALNRLTDEPDAQSAAEELVAAGLWTTTETGWQLVWLQDDQPSAEDAARTREVNANRARRARQHKVGDHSLCTDPRWCGWLRNQGVDAPRHAERHDERTPNVRSPVPSRPDLGQGTGDSGRASGGGGRSGTAAPAADEEDWAAHAAALGMDEAEYREYQVAAAALGVGVDDLGACGRCGVLAALALEANELKEVRTTSGTEEFLCPTCYDISQRLRGSYVPEGKEGCLALKRNGTDCSQPAQRGSFWCQFHQHERKRGKNPGVGQRRLDRLRAEVARA